jgi:hypothetical protein
MRGAKPAPVVSLSLVIWMTATGAFAGDGPPLRLLWIDTTEKLPFAYATLVDASTRALAPIGVSVTWERVSIKGEAPEGLRVLLLPRAPARGTQGAMGHVKRQETPVTDVYVFLASVAEALRLDPGDPNEWRALERQELGRALGRVVAHEVVHVLRPGLPHAAQGLFAATLARRDLLTRAPLWDPATVESLARPSVAIRGPVVASVAGRLGAALEVASLHRPY